MTRVSTVVLLILVLVAVCSAQTQTGSQEQTSAPTQGESSSRDNPDASPAAPLNPPPDLSEKARRPTGVKGVIDRVAPHCAYVIYSVCWEMRSNRRPEAEKQPNDEYVKSLEVGDFYFKHKNFRAAGSRYSDALAQKPNDPEATFRFAKSLEMSNDTEHARTAYQAYLMVAPGGAHSAEARSALERLPSH
jgi:hypothetical protein